MEKVGLDLSGRIFRGRRNEGQENKHDYEVADKANLPGNCTFRKDDGIRLVTYTY